MELKESGLKIPVKIIIEGKNMKPASQTDNTKTKIGDLSLEDLKSFINDTVDKRLEERLGDPDVGLEVKPEVIDKILRSRDSKTISAEELSKRFGLKW